MASASNWARSRRACWSIRRFAALVLALDSPSGKQLAGYVASAVAEQDEDAQAALREALKTHLKQQLPDYMVPAHLLLLASLPLTANGKLDRRAAGARPGAQPAGLRGPRSVLEQQLAGVWREVLNVERVGLGDNFFELGGDSILSIQVVSRARQLGIHFSPATCSSTRPCRASPRWPGTPGQPGRAGGRCRATAR